MYDVRYVGWWDTYTGGTVRAEVSVLPFVFAVEDVEFQAILEAENAE